MHADIELPGTLLDGDEVVYSGAVAQHFGCAGDLDPPVKGGKPAGCGLGSESHEHAESRYGYGPAVGQSVLLSPSTYRLALSFGVINDREIARCEWNRIYSRFACCGRFTAYPRVTVCCCNANDGQEQETYREKS